MRAVFDLHNFLEDRGFLYFNTCIETKMALAQLHDIFEHKKCMSNLILNLYMDTISD